MWHLKPGDTNIAQSTVQVLSGGKIYDRSPDDMMNFNDTIAAIATAPGSSALAVVRISGPDAMPIAKRIFSPTAIQEHSSEVVLKPHHATYGFIIAPEDKQLIDEVVVTAFAAPRTYTGEDLVEISCHGGPVSSRLILNLILKEGARLAKAGEFTQRAYLSGRIDLTQAEAVLDLIQSKTGRQSRKALSALTGALGDQINQVRTQLMELSTRIVAGLDFPEEIGDLPEPEVEVVVRRNIQKLDELSATCRSGRFLRQGLKLAIVGRPNAGKSSLLNQLLKFERAIVTDIPGTTRDLLEELLDLNGIPIMLVDTAGIRHTKDEVERLGIERTKRAIAESDLVLLVADLSAGWGKPEDEVVEMLDGKPFFVVANKIDLNPSSANIGNSTAENFLGAVAISASLPKNIEQLTSEIEKFALKDEIYKEGPSLNQRQADLCLKARAALQLALDSLTAGGYLHDCLASDLKTALDSLSEISGQSVSEEVITQVFASFCIGK
jgi:tRNA modification GTPase